jgi:hypothetical protein
MGSPCGSTKGWADRRLVWGIWIIKVYIQSASVWPKLTFIRGGSSGSGSSERFGTIGGLSSNTPPSRGPRGPAPSADDNKDPDKRETWFAGGEKRCVGNDSAVRFQSLTLMVICFSGLSIQNPEAAQNVPGGNLVRDLLRRAAEYVSLAFVLPLNHSSLISEVGQHQKRGYLD